MGFILVLLLVLLAVFSKQLLYRCVAFFSENAVLSTVDGNFYPVSSLYTDQEGAANRIAEINMFAVQVISALKKTYLTTPPIFPEQIKGFEIASVLNNRYSSKSLSENVPTSTKDTSFTQNKGETISLCLREKESGKNALHSADVLKFVMLHELSHIVTPELDHSLLFWDNFRFLLEFCSAQGLYTAPNYVKPNEKYCGLSIKYNPVYDASIKKYFGWH